MNNLNNWIEHLHHPLVFAGFGLFLLAMLLRPLFLNNKKLSGTAIERLLSKGMILVFILALLAIIGGVVLSWKATPEAVPEKTGKFNTSQSIQQYEEELKKLKQQVVDLQSSGVIADEKQRHLLEAQLQGVREHLSDVRKSWEETKARLKATEANLDKFKGQFPEARIAAAKESLKKGDTEAAEQLLDEVVDKGSGPIALAAYQSGQLAEGRFDYAKAMRQYKKAAALEEDNPEYLLAAGRMACTLADYDRAQEWLTKMPNGMTDDQVFNFINLSIRLLHDTGKYREMCILMIFDIQVRSLFGKLDWGTGLNNILLIAIYIQPEELNLFISHFEFFEIMKASQLFKKSINKVFEDEEFVVYLKNENFKEAVSVLRSYLGVMEKTLGQDHPEIALLYSSFAFFYLSQGDYKKAAPLIQRALHIKEKTLGKNHPSVAITLNALALMHILQEHYEKADSLYQRSLNIVSTSFGNNHPLVAAALNNLSELYKIQGRDEEANSLYQRSLAIQKAGDDKKTEDLFNDQKTKALFQRIVSIISHNSHLLNIDQAYYDDDDLIKRKIIEQ